MVPTVLLSALLVVTGAVGAQANTDNTIITPNPSVTLVTPDGPVKRYPVYGKIEITRSVAKFQTNVSGTKYTFIGQGAGKPVPETLRFDFGGRLDINQNQSFQKLIKDSRGFKYTYWSTEMGTMFIDFLFLDKNGNELGSLNVLKMWNLGYTKYRLIPEMRKALSKGGEGVGEWKTAGSDLSG